MGFIAVFLLWDDRKKNGYQSICLKRDYFFDFESGIGAKATVSLGAVTNLV